MKDYVSLLSKEDTLYICKIIGGKLFRDLYKKNTKAFNKILPGFRADSLSDDKTFNVVVTNKDTGFIASFLNAWLNDMMMEIEEAKCKKLNEGLSETDALIEVLPLSVFDNKPELYFTLIGTSLDVADADMFYRVLDLSKKNKELSAHVEDGVNSTEMVEKATKALQEQHDAEIAFMQESHNAAIAESQLELSELREKNAVLQTKLESKNQEIESLKKNLEEYDTLSAFKVEKHKIMTDAEYYYTSLCKVYVDSYGNTKLRRLADICDGEINTIFLEEAPEYVSLFKKDGPSQEGYIGLWDWKTVPSKNDPSKDYIQTKFNKTNDIVELICVQSCNNISELIKKLLDGFDVDTHTDTVMFIVKTENGYEGIYCDGHSVELQSKKVTINPTTIKLPVYRISVIDILKFEDVLILMSSKIGMPTRIIRVREPIEVVQKIITDRTTWTVMQQKGFIRNEYKQIKEYLSGMPTTDLFDEICSVCDCSTEEAKKFVESFISQSDTLITGGTFENGVLAQIIRNNPDLYQECLETINNDWEMANQKKIEAAEKAYGKIKEDEKKCIEICTEEQRRCRDLEQKCIDLERKIAEQEELAQDVHERVLAKIEQARSNAAEFIAENAFIHISKIDKPVENVVVSDNYNDEISLFCPSDVYKTEEPDLNDDYGQLLQSIQSELCEAGVSDASLAGLSAILYSAFINKIPLLLAGPNSKDIVEAFSIALECRTPAVIKCEGVFDTSAMMQCEDSEEKIVMIDQPFAQGWENSILNLISKRKKFYILVHPFSEDLSIEPRSLFNYCVPIFTELLVDNLPTGSYIGGMLSEKYKKYEPATKIDKYYNKMLESMKIYSIAKRNIQQLAADLHVLLKSNEVNSDYQILLYPLAFATGELGEFSKNIDTANPKPSSALCEQFRRLIGERE